MEVKEWTAVRDELAAKVENWLDGQGYDALSVKAGLMAASGYLQDDRDGQSIVEECLAKALGLHRVYIHGYVVRCYPSDLGAWLETPLPIPIREFVRGWNEGILQ